MSTEDSHVQDARNDAFYARIRMDDLDCIRDLLGDIFRTRIFLCMCKTDPQIAAELREAMEGAFADYDKELEGLKND